jgi:hypothetical protein
MAWERGYYYRVRKVNGRVIREYFGRGSLAELVAEEDAIERKRREAERAMRRAKQAELDALDAPVKELNAIADLLARAALLVVGFQQHNRGEWRKTRGRRECNQANESD